MEDQAGGEEWTPPDQSAYVVVSSAGLTASTQGNGFDQPASMALVGYAPPPQYQEAPSSVGGQQFAEPGPSGSAAGQYNEAAVAVSSGFSYGGDSADFYRAVVAQGAFQRGSGGVDNLVTYAGIQSDAAAQLLTASAPMVESSSLPASFQVVLDGEHRVVAVQRVVAPADCSVSQASLAVAAQDAPQPSTSRILPASSAGQTYVQVTSMPAAYHAATLGMGSDLGGLGGHNEVSTTGGAGSPLLHPGQAGEAAMVGVGMDDREAEQHISSMGSMHLTQTTSRGTFKMDTVQQEQPDTTQEDVRDYVELQPGSRNFIHDAMDLNSDGLHSTVEAVPRSLDVAMVTGGLSSSQEGLGALAYSHPAPPTPRMPDSSGTVNPGDYDSLVSDSNDSVLGAAVVEEVENHKDSQPQSSEVRQVRKSSRLAYLDQEASSSWQRPTYQPRPYNPDELWCEECMQAYMGECPAHRLTMVEDKVVLSRAWASLPPSLVIYKIAAEGNELGVFARKPVLKMTQFGPFVGDLVTSQDRVTNRLFHLMLEKPDGSVAYFETADENKCNWMMFVRPAKNFAEQNMVAYQYGQDIFFTVTKIVDARTELKVWYAAPYAERIGMPLLEITDQDIEVLDAQEKQFSCHDCPKRFKTQAALQRHMVMHEEAPQDNSPYDADFSAPSTSGTQRQRRSSGSMAANPEGSELSFGEAKPSIFRSRQRKEGGEAVPYNWKKRSTSIYLNKTLKKYQKRPGADRIRQTIKSMYTRKGKLSGGNEWVCTHCDLTFDNANLLNIHTLTHAAEDVGLDELRKMTGEVKAEGAFAGGAGGMEEGEGEERLVSLETCLVCPMCHVQFDSKRELIEHAADHGKIKRKPINLHRPFKCEQCWKGFTSHERLRKHMLCHQEGAKPLQCQVCKKRFMNNSALACHMKTHSSSKYYQCAICHTGFDMISAMKEHIVTHLHNNVFTCPDCHKEFDNFNMIRKHMRAFHTNKKFACKECNKVFPRPDKLKLHMLRHSTHREFMCESCGRQFKRKDKLKEHMKRMHSDDREAKLIIKGHGSSKKFVPKVSPTDFHRFIYKCHSCMLGFKRRGMLVNHLAKRHPDIKPDTVPELNLPILKTQRDYFCQYCDKVYKSSSKRKAHILKNHPGSELPLSSRKKFLVAENMQNPTYSQTVGSITTLPQSCHFCHKQYASKAKLMQHQRRKHPDLVPAVSERRRKSEPTTFAIEVTPATAGASNTTTLTVNGFQEVTLPIQGADAMQAADLLTQAMRSLGDCTSDADYLNRMAAQTTTALPGTVVQMTPGGMGQVQATTIELSQLGLTHTQFAGQPGTATVIAATPATMASQPVTVSVVTANNTQTQPITIPAQVFVPRSWSTTTYQTVQHQ